MRLLWLDLETTGLDPKTEAILALGVIVTDENLRELARREYFVSPPSHNLAHMTPFVRDMHRSSGLLAKVERSLLRLPDAVTLLHPFLDCVLEGQKATLAGSSVHFDRGFLAQHAPSLLAYVGHRHLDVSTLKVIGNMWGRPDFESVRGHTPLADLERSLREFRHWRQQLLFAGVLPPAVLADTWPLAVAAEV